VSDEHATDALAQLRCARRILARVGKLAPAIDDDIAVWLKASEWCEGAQGLHLVSAADKAVLDALDKTSLADLQFLPGLDGILDGVYVAVLRRRQANGTGDSRLDRELALMEAKRA
jgi:hypothetical protein